MRSAFVCLVALGAVAVSGHAMAQSTTIITEEPGVVTRPVAPMMTPPGVVVDRVAPDVPATTGTIGETAPGCASTVTRQESPDGTSTTVRQERCNPIR
jgi:hypothetical protein